MYQISYLIKFKKMFSIYKNYLYKYGSIKGKICKR